MRSRWTTLGAIALAAVGSAVAIGVATGGHDLPSAPADATWTTIFKSPAAIEGLTGDDAGRLYVAGRAPAGAPCPVWRVDSAGPANQTPTVVGYLPAPSPTAACSPSGLTFGPDGRLYVTGVADTIVVLTPDEAAPPTATQFATGTPGANGIAFDRDGNLYASDGGTNQGRVFRVGPAGGAATELFRIPPPANSVGVGRVNSTLQPPPAASSAQNIVANGLAFTKDGKSLLVADTARGALWQVDFAKDGSVDTPTGCDPTYAADTLCIDALVVENPLLEGADGIALDKSGKVWVDANERNAIVVVDEQGRVGEYFRNPVGAGNLRNGGPLELPTSPFLTDRTLCTTSSDGNRRDNSPNSAGEAAPGTAVVGKISCFSARLREPGLPLPVR